jgi:hypothetical protein
MLNNSLWSLRFTSQHMGHNIAFPSFFFLRVSSWTLFIINSTCTIGLTARSEETGNRVHPTAGHLLCTSLNTGVVKLRAKKEHSSQIAAVPPSELPLFRLVSIISIQSLLTIKLLHPTCPASNKPSRKLLHPTRHASNKPSRRALAFATAILRIPQ